MTRLEEFRRYSTESLRIGDVDPGKRMLRYLADRFELNVEQRYWLAWLASMTYCGASAFYLYNEMPDYENCDLGRMNRWWYGGGRDALLVQSDRRWVRSSHQFIPAFETYRQMLGGKTQEEFFSTLCEGLSAEQRCQKVMETASQMHSFGQFSLFIYTEFLHCVTPTKMCPTDLDLDKAWSCRFGLYFAYDRDEWITDGQSPILAHQREETAQMWDAVRNEAKSWAPEPNIWELETLTCAYRKWSRGKRYVGAYIDRECGEISKMENSAPNGVCWDVLWDYRRETYDTAVLAEAHDHAGDRGVSKAWKQYRIEATKHILEST